MWRAQEFSEQAGDQGMFIHPGDHPNRLAPAAQKEIRDRLLAAEIDLVVLAGFMRLLKAEVLDAFARPDRQRPPVAAAEI